MLIEFEVHFTDAIFGPDKEVHNSLTYRPFTNAYLTQF